MSISEKSTERKKKFLEFTLAVVCLVVGMSLLLLMQ
jgi:hypothetical protein